MKFEDIRDRLPSLEFIIRSYGIELARQGSRWVALCPWHEDNSPSFSIFPDGRRCGCFRCDINADVFAFVQRMESLSDAGAAARFLCEKYCVSIELQPQHAPQKEEKHKLERPPSEPAEPKRQTKRGPETEHYDYLNANGKLIYRVIRYALVYEDTGEPAPGKTFGQARFHDGQFSYNMRDVEYVLYRLPNVLPATTVWLCEGERDVHALEAHGVIATTDAGGCGARRKFVERGYPEQLKGKRIVLVPDSDQVGQERGAMLAHALHGVAESVHIVNVGPTYKDVRDFLEGGGTVAQLESTKEEYRPGGNSRSSGEPQKYRRTNAAGSRGMRSGIASTVANGHQGLVGWQHCWPAMKANGSAPQPVLANALFAFREAPEFAGKLHYDEFAIRVVARGALPWGGGEADVIWTDQQERLACEWLQLNGLMVTPLIVGQAIETVARENSFHPVRDYLNTCLATWDKQPRIDRLLEHYFGVDVEGQELFAAAAGRCWMISAVARVFQMGAKADCALILEGDEGIRKSSALRVLGDPWFADELADMGSKDAAIQCAGVWIIELAELNALTGRNSDWEKVKSFMSRSTDRYRPPYGRRAEEFPRQCVFAGTANISEYLSRIDGIRRFWPFWCNYISLDALNLDRDQLWGEAVYRFKAGEKWWFDDPRIIKEAREQQKHRLDQDAWEELVLDWCKMPSARHFPSEASSLSSTPGSIVIGEVLQFCLGKLEKEWTRSDQMRVSQILKSAGYLRRRIGTRGEQEWRYIKAVV